ncbi:MAG: HAD family hydrolase [Endomicrobium sp.]|jgi:phosphoglycolate phosphatase|nr:HAD family hydrolase [Endomicrobium sp.]
MPDYIFDLDGTLADSSHEVINCLKLAFQQAGYYVAKERFSSDIMGPPMRQIVKNAAPELTDERIIETVVKNYRQIYDYDENDVTKLYDGIYDFLLSEKSAGSKLFVATFKPKLPTSRLLKALKIDALLDDVYCVDKFDVPLSKTEMIEDIVKKYSLDKSKTYMIGDRDNDIIAAKEAGVKAAAALWGYGDDKTFIKENADISISHISQLKRLK